MQYKTFFNFEQYHHPHKRHDPPGSEDADVNNDGKVDKNDKYIMAKRRLYKQYQAAQKTKKATDFSTPKLENNMIRLSGLVNLESLKEEEKWIQKAIEKPGALHKQLGVPADEKIPAGKLAAAAEKGGKLGKRARLAMTLKKLKEMQMDPEQEKKVDELLAQYEELTAKQKQLDVDGDGEIEGSDLAALRGKKSVTEYDEDDYDARRDDWYEKSDEPYRSPYDRGPSKSSVPKKTAPATTGPSKDSMLQQTVKYKDADGKEHQATVKSLLGYAKDHPGRKAAARVYAQHMSKQKSEVVLENEDHEVSMGNNALDDIIKNATELKGKLGMQEKDVPAWIQDHISQAQNFIAQANTNFHDYDEPKNVPHPETDKPVDQDLDAMKETVNEVAPTGWEKTVLAMKKHKEIDNPWALAHWMKKKGYHPQNESVVAEESIEEIGMVKKAAYIAKAAKDVWKQRGYEKDSEKQANVAPRIGKSGKETPASARDRAGARVSADMARKQINKRVKGIDTARGFKGSTAKVKNPETGKEILATTAAKDKDHPAHNAAKSALGKK